MIKTGDKVKFLNDVGGGVVTSFISNEMVNVENEDGFEIPYPISQLLNVSAPELNSGFTEKKKPEPGKSGETTFESTRGKTIPGKNSPDFYFCFVPENETSPSEGEVALHLVNDSNYTVMFHFSHFDGQRSTTVKYGNVQPNSSILLESIAKTDLQELPVFRFQLLHFKDNEEKWNEPVAKSFTVNPVKFHKETSFTENQYFSGKAMIFQITGNIFETELDKLTENDFRKIVKEKEQKPKTVKTPRKRTTEIVEIDLHINQLLDNVSGLSNHEILEYQKEAVEKEMRAAIQSGVKRIVFIHGVGQGVLKQEVANVLKLKFKKYRYQDASFKEYGYGATMVILRR